MRRAALLPALVVIGLGAAPARASTQHVDAQFSVFAPTPLDVLPGESVQWDNVSERRHTVTADDGSYDSGDLLGGDSFTERFTTVGRFAYHCTVHPEMFGEIDVRKVTLETLPPSAVLPGQRVEFAGRTATPRQRVTIEERTGSERFRPVGSAKPAPNGSWRTTLPARASAQYRAAVGAEASEVRRLLVTTRKVHVRATRRGVVVSVTPSAPEARVALQERLPERFGWWPERRVRLDYLSRASFLVTRPARVRVVMVAKDGWTPVAISRVLRLR
jgi:plastocyanin